MKVTPSSFALVLGVLLCCWCVSRRLVMSSSKVCCLTLCVCVLALLPKESTSSCRQLCHCHCLCPAPCTLQRLLLLCAVGSRVLASENGAYYECDVTSLSNNNECIFVKSSSAPATWGSVGPHNTTARTTWNAYDYRVFDMNDNVKNASPQPLTEGDHLMMSSSSVSGVDWMWVLATEVAFSIRNVVMYHPSNVANDYTEWTRLVQTFADCHVKDTDVTLPGEPTGYGRDSVFEMLSDPNGNSIVTGDIHNQLLQFLEEGSVDLACLMVDSSVSTLVPGFERCVVIREAWGLADDEISDCFVNGYTTLFGEAPSLSDNTLTTATYNSASRGAKGITTSTVLGIVAAVFYFVM